MSDTSQSPYDCPMEHLRDESNFYNWKFDITLRLGVLGLTDVLLGTCPRPATPPSSSPSPSPKRTPEQKQWDVASGRAMIFIFHRVVPRLQGLVSLTSTAPEVWKTLMRHFHRREPRMLLRSLGAITRLNLGEDQPITEHIAAFEDAWFELKMRTEDAPPVVDGVQSSLETVLGLMANSELTKAEMLIDSLPMDIWMIGWGLQERYGVELKSSHVRRKLLEIHYQRESRRKKQEEEEEAVEDCTWCRSRGYESAGHGWKKCVRLRQFKKEKADRRARRA